MTIHTRVGIVICTIGACFLGWETQRREESATREPDPCELFEAVQVHLSALKRQHYRQAYLQVSSGYQDRRDMERFVESLRVDAFAVRQSARWEFGAPAVKGDLAEVPVTFFMPSGDVFLGEIALLRESRSWKVDWIWISARTHSAKTIPGTRM
jgi:hypothetical protein